MRVRKVAVVGGGPGGLYAARLAKLADPACAVTVYEQGEPDTTFGFGVGLAAGTQRKLEAADPDSLHDLVAAGRRHDMTLDVRGVGGGVVRVRNDRLIGVARTELLAILQRHAEKAGVALEFGGRRSAADLDADVVVAADGVSSATREAGPFGEHVELGRGLYLWCGTDFALDDAVFAPVTTEHGVFVTHAYPYGSGRSTFLIETDEADLAPCGLRRRHRRHPVRRVGRDVAALPRDRVRRAAPRPPVDRQPHPVAPVPHGHLRPLVAGAHRAPRRRRAHGALLHRLRHEARDGGRDRVGRGAPRRAGSGERVRGVRAPSPSRRGAAAGARPSQQAVVGVVPGAAVAARRPADGGVHVAGGERAARPVRRDQPGRRGRGAAPVRRRCGPDRPGRRHRVGAGAAGGGACRLGDRRRAVRRPVGPGGDAVVARAGRVGLRLVGPPDRDAVLNRLDLAERVRIETGNSSRSMRPPRCATTSPPGW